MRRAWGEEAVVYDPLSGSTHLIDPVAAAVLDHLTSSSGSVTALAGLLQGEFDADCEEDVLAAVLAALAKLRDIGLVRSTTE